jgi:hypothetical protein
MPKKGSKKRISAAKPKVAKKTEQEQAHSKKVIGSFKLTGRTFNILKMFWRPLGGILLVYIFLSLVFATGLISSISSSVHTTRHGGHVSFKEALGGFNDLLVGANASSDSAMMQSILLVIVSLAVIWALRHLLSGEEVKVKKAFYHGPASVIPFLIVMFFIILQLLPITIGAAVLAVVFSSAINTGTFLSIIFAIIFLLLTAWSIYMVSSSVFALYIVTLPNIDPREALKSAKNLVKLRRLQIIRRQLFLPLSLVLMIGVIMVPLLLVNNFLTVTAFFILSLSAIIYSHTYLYSLYKDLLE